MADRYGGSGGRVGQGGSYVSGSTDGGRVVEDMEEGAHSGALQGAQVGMSVGGPMGAMFGAIAGGIRGLIKGGVGSKAKQRAEREKQRAWEAAKTQLAQERYGSRVAATRNISNAYSPANAQLARMYGQAGALDFGETPWGSDKKPKGKKTPARGKPQPSPAEAAPKHPKAQYEDKKPVAGKTGGKPQVL